MTDRLQVMTASEVATLLRVNVKTVYAAAANQELPCRRIGRRVLFYRPAIVAWLQQQGRVALERQMP